MLERTEKLENLRMLEAGFTLYLAEVDSVGLAIDTEADFEKARRYLSSC
jgi:3-deoxy-manno-octulosonate cytidylyltransferase (CMP-KDO synthetase)